MPRKRQDKKPRETRIDKKKKEVVKALKENADRMGQAEYLPPGHIPAAFRTETGRLMATTLPKEIYNRHGAFGEKYGYIDEQLSDIIGKTIEKTITIWHKGTLDERHDHWKEVISTFGKAASLFDDLDPIGYEMLQEGIDKLNCALFDLREIQRRTDELLRMRKPFKKYIHYYEAKFPPRPNFKVRQACLIEAKVSVIGNEDVPERELSFRIEQYKAWFMIQYYRFCAPLDKTKRHKKLKKLLEDTNAGTRAAYNQVQMPEETFQGNFLKFLPFFLETVMRNGGRKAKCTYLLSVLPKGVRLPWDKTRKKTHYPEKYMFCLENLEIGLENLPDEQVD